MQTRTSAKPGALLGSEVCHVSDAEVIAFSVGFLAATSLIEIAIVKTVRHHGWGKQTWAPPAAPWFWAAMGVSVVTLAAGIILAAN